MECHSCQSAERILGVEILLGSRGVHVLDLAFKSLEFAKWVWSRTPVVSRGFGI